MPASSDTSKTFPFSRPSTGCPSMVKGIIYLPPVSR
jgi:hypothetical protein